jgi:predicted secreted acid phosphatase
MNRSIAVDIDSLRFVRKLALLLIATVLLAAGSGAARAQTPAGCGQPLSSSDPHFLDLVYYRCHFYDQDVAAALQNARSWVDWRAAYVHHPALVLDIDETSLTNWKQMYQDKFVYIAKGPCSFRPGATCSQEAWEQIARAPALTPTRDLFYAAGTDHVTVFFVTGRKENPVERIATVRNLHRAGYARWKQLFMRTKRFNNPSESVSVFKTWARSQITAQGYTIIANVGDQWSDLDGGYSEHTFKVSNPFYYIP